MDDYHAFLAKKALVVPPAGMTTDYPLSKRLFDWQRDIVQWALRRGRACLFLDCGLGKSVCQLEWSRVICEHVGPVLIVCPLAVAEQTVAERAKFKINVGIKYARCQSDALTDGITITNYEMLDNFDAMKFAGVVLDESSRIKGLDSKTRSQVLAMFQATPYRLACTATPAPNDYMELGNHSEFMGALTRPEMLATFFVHDGGNTSQWRLKGHAQRDFWKWVASWSIMMRKPSDLGYSDNGFVLPPLRIHELKIETGNCADGFLFPMPATGLVEQRSARKSTLTSRVQSVAHMVNNTPGQWLVFCELNDEGNQMAKAINGAVQVAGADSQDAKIERLHAFLSGDARVMISKPVVFGYGLNLQCCHQMAFVGVSHSYEQTYQAMRRCWRFGQTQPVDCYIVTTDLEENVWHNIQRKQHDADTMAAEMVKAMSDESSRQILGASRMNETYRPTKTMVLPTWLRIESEGA